MTCITRVWLFHTWNLLSMNQAFNCGRLETQQSRSPIVITCGLLTARGASKEVVESPWRGDHAVRTVAQLTDLLSCHDTPCQTACTGPGVCKPTCTQAQRPFTMPPIALRRVLSVRHRRPRFKRCSNNPQAPHLCYTAVVRQVAHAVSIFAGLPKRSDSS